MIDERFLDRIRYLLLLLLLIEIYNGVYYLNYIFLCDGGGEYFIDLLIIIYELFEYLMNGDIVVFLRIQSI